MKKSMLNKCGKKVYIGYNSNIVYKNVDIGNNVFLNSNCTLLCANARIIINDNVMFGPNVTVVTGSHQINIPGKYMIDVTVDEKDHNCDQNVVFEGDNWVASNSIILRGVTIGRGAVIGAGSVVTKSVPPYAVVAGNPAKIIKNRFTDIELEKHERILIEKKDELI